MKRYSMGRVENSFRLSNNIVCAAELTELVKDVFHFWDM